MAAGDSFLTGNPRGSVDRGDHGEAGGDAEAVGAGGPHAVLPRGAALAGQGEPAVLNQAAQRGPDVVRVDARLFAQPA